MALTRMIAEPVYDIWTKSSHAYTCLAMATEGTSPSADNDGYDLKHHAINRQWHLKS